MNDERPDHIAGLATRIASAFLGERTQSVRQIVGRGTQNWIFVVTTARTSVVVRMSDDPHAQDIYAKETWCIEQAAACGVPGPHVLAVGEVDRYAYMLQTLVSGENGEESVASRTFLWTEMGRYARRIHAIPVGGFGEALADITTGRPGRSWQRFLDYNVESLSDTDPLRRLGVVTAAQSEQLRITFEALGERPFHFGLNHGDLALRNLVVDVSGSASLLDWGCAEAHIVPHYDLIRMKEWIGTDVAEMRAFLDGYGLSEAEHDAMRADLDALTVLKAIDLTRWALERQPSVVGEHLTRARRLVRKYVDTA